MDIKLQHFTLEINRRNLRMCLELLISEITALYVQISISRTTTAISLTYPVLVNDVNNGTQFPFVCSMSNVGNAAQLHLPFKNLVGKKIKILRAFVDKQ